MARSNDKKAGKSRFGSPATTNLKKFRSAGADDGMDEDGAEDSPDMDDMDDDAEAGDDGMDDDDAEDSLEDDDDDDAEAGDIDITHDDDSGALDIHHEPDVDDDNATEGDDDMDEDDMDLDDGDDDDATLAAIDDDGDDDGDDSPDMDEDDAEACRADDEGDSPDEDSPDEDEDDLGPEASADWVESSVVGAMFEAVAEGVDLSKHKAVTKAVRRIDATAGDFLGEMTKGEYRALVKIANPVIEECVAVSERLAAGDSEFEQMKKTLVASGRTAEAASLDAKYRSARAEDIEGASLDFICPDWLVRKAAAFLVEAEGEMPDDEVPEPEHDGPEPDETVDADDDADMDDMDDEDNALASVLASANGPLFLAARAAALHRDGDTRTAALLVTGKNNKATRESVRILDALLRQGKTKTAAKMVVEAHTVLGYGLGYDPNNKPAAMDPTQPVTPGGGVRFFGPPPDAGFSYGLPDEEIDKACEQLAVSRETLGAWVPELPKKGKSLDTKGKVAVFTQTPGQGDKQYLSFAEAKTALSSKNFTTAMMLADTAEMRNLKTSEMVVALTGAETADPCWNLIARGIPVAAVFLQDQDRPEHIRATFCSQTYGSGIIEAAANFGLDTALESIRARRWAAAFSATQEAAGMREQIEKRASALVEEEVGNRFHGFLANMVLAHHAVQSGFAKVEDPLRAALFDRLVQAGVANPAPVINAAFEQQFDLGDGQVDSSMAHYLRLLIAKAVEFSDMEPKALAQIAEHIMGRKVEVKTAEVGSLKERLSRSAAVVQAVNFMPSGQAAPDLRDRLKKQR